ncbi:MAG: tetratricopeptide repeat protein [Phycisphaerales bacterium]|nr:tetratricopeptide repeat protein [Phycisphaerales bacterium]
MRSTPIIAVVLAILLLGGIYRFANTTPQKSKLESGKGLISGAQMSNPVLSIDVDSFIVATKKLLPQHALGEIQAVDKQLLGVSDSLKMLPFFEQYAQIWKEHKQPVVAAHYYSLVAKLENSEKKLTFAAQLFLNLARNEHSESLQKWEAANAIGCFEKSLRLNSNNDSTRLSLAECYFGTGEAMKGVALVKEITAKSPENKAANMLLGQQGLISGQFAKAQLRFETVLKNEPKNLEAMLGLAEAYKGLGEKKKAIALLENCKKQITNPAFAKDIDEYIKTIN